MAHAARLPNKHIAAFRYNDKIRHARALLCILFAGQVAAKRDDYRACRSMAGRKAGFIPLGASLAAGCPSP